MELKDKRQSAWCQNCRSLMVQLERYEPTPLDTVLGVASPDSTEFVIGIVSEKVSHFARSPKNMKQATGLKSKGLDEFPKDLVGPAPLAVLP